MPEEYAKGISEETLEEILKGAERRCQLRRSLRRWKFAVWILLLLLALSECVIVKQGRRLAVCEGHPFVEGLR